MAQRFIQYGAQSGVPFTLNSLASDTNLLAGRQSAIVDNTSGANSGSIDYLVGGKITTGVAPTAGNNIELWVVGKIASTGVTDVYPDAFTGVDSTVSVVSLNTKYAALSLAETITVDSNSNRPYYVKPFSISSRFDGVCPEKFLFYVTHNTGVALSPSGFMQGIWIKPITESFV